MFNTIKNLFAPRESMTARDKLFLSSIQKINIHGKELKLFDFSDAVEVNPEEIKIWINECVGELLAEQIKEGDRIMKMRRSGDSFVLAWGTSKTIELFIGKHKYSGVINL